MSVLGTRAQRDVALGPMTTYRVGGPASVFVEVGCVDDLLVVHEAMAASGLPVLVVGKGSNLLVADRGFDGIAVVLGTAFENVEISGTLVRAGGAAAMPVVARRAGAAGLTGLEWAVGIPGSVGGAVRMNAGGHGSNMAAVVQSCELVDLMSGRRVTYPVERLAYAYRQSCLLPTQVVVEATLVCRQGVRAQAEATIAEIVRWRREHQPGGQNAGSVFTNPPDDAAGRIVEAAGCKGWRLGSAEVSRKHANFIQADEGGSADDVLALVRAVAAEVQRRLGVSLATEIRLVGFPGTYPGEVGEGPSGAAASHG